MKLTAAILAAVTVSCSAPATPPAPGPSAPVPAAEPAAPPTTETLATDTEITVGGAVSLTAPAGWTLERLPSAIVLRPPDGDSSRFAVVQTTATDADAAIAAGWKAIGVTPKYPIKLTQPLPGRDGWAEAKSFSYEVPPNDKRVFFAQALRSDKGWTAIVIDAADATLDKRQAGVGQMFGSMRPVGYSDETFAGKKAHRLDRERVQQIEKFVESSSDLLGIPGVAIALYDNGEIVSATGFGVRALGTRTRAVNADTRFMVASNTKPLTTLMLATLVDEKKVTWDTPVIDRFGQFALGDAETTKRVLFKHLVCACTGLPRQDFEWMFEFAGATPTTTLKSLATMKPTTNFGETFQYSNPLASAAGYAGGHIAFPKLELGAAYDRAMQRRVFDKLGMKSATFDYKKALAGNHAKPHSEDPDGVTRLASMDVNYSIHPLRPAGALWVSANDLLKYLRMELDLGKLPDGKRYISAETLLARRAPQVRTGDKSHYGMGLTIDKTWGIPVISHGGSMIGFKSNMYFFPDHGVAAVILTNSDAGGLLLGPFVRRLVEVMFDGRAEAVEDVTEAAKRRQRWFAKERKTLTIPPDSTAVGKLAKKYKSPDLGELAVTGKNGAVVFDFGEWRSEVATRKNDDGTVSFISTTPGMSGLDFVVAERDGKRALIIRSMQHEYVFSEF